MYKNASMALMRFDLFLMYNIKLNTNNKQHIMTILNYS